MQAFVNGTEGGNPFLFRQILENFKLKVYLFIYVKDLKKIFGLLREQILYPKYCFAVNKCFRLL